VSALKESQGSVVNTASIAGLGTVGSSIAYSAAKAALINLTRDLARALAPEARVNAIAPGAVDSPWMIEWTDEQHRNSIERSLLKRRNQPSDLADVIVFLGFGTTMITGQTVPVDAGLLLG
jgi:3-oxoacyl-[acyl-carrier protein] reductase